MPEEPLQVPHSASFLNNRDPLFWFSCFVRLFPRGDCWEKSAARHVKLASWRWAKTLLTRADFSLWRQDVEFVASVYNVHLRRDQVNAVEASVRKSRFTVQQQEQIEKLVDFTESFQIKMDQAKAERDKIREDF